MSHLWHLHLSCILFAVLYQRVIAFVVMAHWLQVWLRDLCRFDSNGQTNTRFNCEMVPSLVSPVTFMVFHLPQDLKQSNDFLHCHLFLGLVVSCKSFTQWKTSLSLSATERQMDRLCVFFVRFTGYFRRNTGFLFTLVDLRPHLVRKLCECVCVWVWAQCSCYT